MFGSLFGTLFMALAIGGVIYCCCCRRRKTASQPVATTDFEDAPGVVTMGGYAPATDPNVPTYPFPVAKPAEYPVSPA